MKHSSSHSWRSCQIILDLKSLAVISNHYTTISEIAVSQDEVRREVLSSLHTCTDDDCDDDAKIIVKLVT